MKNKRFCRFLTRFCVIVAFYSTLKYNKKGKIKQKYHREESPMVFVDFSKTS